LLISISGNIGNVGIFSNSQKAFCGAAIAVAKFRNHNQLDWVMYYLLSNIGQKKLLKDVKIGSHHNLILADIRKIKISLPKLKEQQKIASILSNVDHLIQKYDSLIESTKRLKQGLMQRLLTKGIGHTKFKKTELGEIPQEWEIKKIKDLTKVSVGLVINPSTYFDENGTVPMITGKNVTENGIVLDDVDFITERSNKLLETTRIWSDDLVTMRVGYPGRTSVVKEEHDGINCASVIITRGNKKFISQFLGYLANSRLISKQITMHQAGGAQQVVNIGSWKEFLIPFPPLPEQQKIVSILSKVDSQIQKQQEYKSKLETLKKGLMQKLLTGQIRVSV